MQTLLPISMSAKQSSHTPSPIQLLFPILRCQGYLTLMPGLITTPRPMRAPNSRNRVIFRLDEGFSGFSKNSALQKYQRVRIRKLRPGWYQVLSYWERSTRKMDFSRSLSPGVRKRAGALHLAASDKDPATAARRFPGKSCWPVRCPAGPFLSGTHRIYPLRRQVPA